MVLDGSQLRKRAVSGTIWSLVSQGSTQTLRLVSNLILTRLLAPELFGLMALVHVFLQGLIMFSDVGIEASIVQHKDAEDERFLNTAWTIQVFRGLGLFLFMCAAAWPLSVAYKEPSLLLLLPAVGLTAFESGFKSTSAAMAARSVLLHRVTLIEVGTQTAGITATVLIALYSPNVWALVIGAHVSALTQVALTHWAIPGIRHRLLFDREIASGLMKFGRWVFLSTAAGFLSLQGDRLLLSTMVPLGVLGVYSLAAQLSTVPRQIAQSLSNKVLFPLFARVLQDPGKQARRRIAKVRGALLAGLLPVPALMIALGDPIVQLMYDRPFWEAGWMLRMLAIGIVAQIMNLTLSPVLLAAGNSAGTFAMVGIRSALILAGMAIGAWLDGIRGVVIGRVAAQWLGYPVLYFYVRKTGVWMLGLDLLGVAYAAVICLLGLLGLGLLPQDIGTIVRGFW